MNNSLKGIKKFSFFEIEKPEKFENQTSLNYNLNDITPVAFKIYNKYYYIAGKLKGDNDKLFRIVKIHPSGKIIKEYTPFTDSILDFDIIPSERNIYFIIIGTDLRNEEEKSVAKVEINENNKIDKIKVIPTPNSIPSIKFFEQNKLQIEIEEKKETEDEDKKDYEKLKEDENLELTNTIYLMHKKDNPNDFYKGDDLKGITDVYVSVQDISYFSISPLMNVLAFSFMDTLVEIKLDSTNKKDKNKIIIVNTPDKKLITNIKYITFFNESILYFSASNNIYYKNYGETKLNIVGDESIHSGAYPKNIDINSKRNILLSTPNTSYIEEYEYKKGIYERINTKVMEKQIRLIRYFNRYYVFVLYEENKPVLCVYDSKNNIFINYDESYKEKDILFIITSEDRIYILISTLKTKEIICLKENEDKKKFDYFYKHSLFEIAYICGKNWDYDKEQLAEIAKAHAEYLYRKGEFERSINQYKLTINYLDPTYVIQKFLEDSKKNYLIQYLEELQNNSEFKRKCKKKSFKDYTTLLLNCYIKQKEIEKLKVFVEKQNIKDEVTIKTAIELCKEINNTELALSFAERAKKEKMEDLYIQILIDIPNDYKDYLRYIIELPKYINEIKDIKKRYKILIEYGRRLLEKKEIIQEIHDTIYKLVDDIINMKNNNSEEQEINNIKYDKILSIYSFEEYENNLEYLLKKIMNKDKDCPKEIIIKSIEIYLEKYRKKEKEEKNTENEYEGEIIRLMEKYEDKLDKNYLLMLFKLRGFARGVAELSKIMNLDQDLLQIYMEKGDYKKINESCKDSMKENKVKDKKINFWLQALYYYLDIANKSNINIINEYLIEVLDNLSKQEDFSPMNLLDILENAMKDKNKIIEIKVIRKYFKDWIKQKRDSLKDDKIESEDNYKKIEEYEKNIKEIQVSAKTFKDTRCSSCKSSLDIPFIYFICGHGYHQSCLDEINGHFECPVCKGKNKQILNKIEEGEKYAREPEKFKEEIDNNNQGNIFNIFADYLGKGVFVEGNNNNEVK